MMQIDIMAYLCSLALAGFGGFCLGVGLYGAGYFEDHHEPV